MSSLDWTDGMVWFPEANASPSRVPTGALTSEQLAEIARRLREATPGPWQAVLDRIYAGDWRVADAVLYQPSDPTDIDGELNAIFIAHARTDIPDLLADNERLRAENALLAEKVDAEADYGAARTESALKRCAEQRHRAHVAEAEVDRLHAALAAAEARAAVLVEVARAVADAQVIRAHHQFGDMDIRVAAGGELIDQARALLAATETEGSEGDGTDA